MKIFLFIIFISLFVATAAYAASSVYYDFSNGQAVPMADSTNITSSYYSFSDGQVIPVTQGVSGVTPTVVPPPNVQVLLFEE